MKFSTSSRVFLTSTLLLLLATNAFAANSRAFASATAGDHSIGKNMRRRMHQTATANAVANSVNGASVTSIAGATADQRGSSSANVQGSGSGQGTVVNCQLQTGPGEARSKECIKPSGAVAGAAATAVPTWASAPACRSESSKASPACDQQGYPWGYENKQSCALRDAYGKPTAGCRAQQG